MTLYEQLTSNKSTALKTGNKQLNTLLGTLLGEIQIVRLRGKIAPVGEPTDEECISAIKKMIDSCTECNELEEVKLLETYMPSKLTDEKLGSIISSFCLDNAINEKRQMGEVMNFLKLNYLGQYDGKSASIIIMKHLK